MRTVRSLFEASQVIKQLQDQVEALKKTDNSNYVTKTDLQNALANLSSTPSTVIDDSSTKLKCRVYISANQAIPTVVAGALTPITFDSETFNFGALHSTSVNTSRITATKAGDVLLVGQVNWAGQTAGTFRTICIVRNNTTLEGVCQLLPSTTINQSIHMQVHAICRAATNDYFELQVKQDSGGNLNVSATYTWFAMTYID